MRVAHGHHAHPGNAQLAQRQIEHGPAIDLVADETDGVEGHTFPIKDGRPHVHRDTAIGVHAQLDLALLHLDAHGAFVGQALVAHIAHKAAGPVAAMLHLTAIGVVDHVFKIQPGRGRGPNREDLVGPHAKVAVGQKTVLGRAQAQAALRLVEHDKIVAGPLHLGKADVHGRDYHLWPTPEQASSPPIMGHGTHLPTPLPPT